MEPLIFKIETQADDSGVRQYDKSLGGLDVSSKKASGALKNFVKGLSEAKDGADIASSALGAFGQVLGSSIAGTAIIIAGKTLIDSFNKINQAVKESEKAVAEAFAGMDKASEAMSFAEATAQAKNFESVAETIRKKIKEINESPLDSIIDAITQSTSVMDIQALLVENQAKEIKRLGAESELVHLQKMQGLDAENKALELNSRALAKELDGISAIDESETALAVTRKYQLQADEIRAKFADERSKVETENASTRQKEIDAQIKKEQELAAVQQKRFNDLYNAEVRAQEATQSRVDANLKGEQDLADKQKALQDELEAAKGATLGGGGGGGGSRFSGGGGGAGKYNGQIPGLSSRGPGQRQTSAEVGAAAEASREYEKRRQQEASIFRDNVSKQLKEKGQESGRSAVDNEIRKRNKEKVGLEGANSEGLKEYNDRISKSAQDIADFNNSTASASKSSIDFSSNMSDVLPSFDDVIKSSENLADSITENAGNMVDDFLKTGSQSSDLGKEFDKAAESVKGLGNKIEKASPAPPPPSKGDKGGEGKGSLGSIEKLLKDNFDELKAYAHAT